MRFGFFDETLILCTMNVRILNVQNPLHRNLNYDQFRFQTDIHAFFRMQSVRTALMYWSRSGLGFYSLEIGQCQNSKHAGIQTQPICPISELVRYLALNVLKQKVQNSLGNYGYKLNRGV